MHLGIFFSLNDSMIATLINLQSNSVQSNLQVGRVIALLNASPMKSINKFMLTSGGSCDCVVECESDEKYGHVTVPRHHDRQSEEADGTR